MQCWEWICERPCERMMWDWRTMSEKITGGSIRAWTGRLRDVDDISHFCLTTESEFICTAISNLKSPLSPPKIPTLHAERAAVLTFLSVLSSPSLIWKAGTKQHDIRSQHSSCFLVNRYVSRPSETTGWQGYRADNNILKSCYVIVLYQKLQ